MARDYPDVAARHSAAGAVERLLVRPRDAWQMLGCGNTRGYALLKAGELKSFLDGSARKITVESIKDYIARKLANGDVHLREPPRRRGRARGLPASEGRR